MNAPCYKSDKRYLTVASKMVSMKTHQFRNGSKMEISYPTEESDSEESDDESDELELEQPPGKAVLSMYGDTGNAGFDLTDPFFVVIDVAHYIDGMALI